jgi:Glycosyl-transferase for dystroglycan
MMSDSEDPSHRHDDTINNNLKDQQYHALPSPIAAAKQMAGSDNWWSSFLLPSTRSTYIKRGSSSSPALSFKGRESTTSDTLLPTTYAVKGAAGSGHAGNLHQRNVVGVAEDRSKGEETKRGYLEQQNHGKHHHHDGIYSDANSPYRTASSMLNCTSFLLGGQYYPGKDKKRRIMSRKTLWYRIFCSSPTRKLLSWVVVSYALFRLVGWLFWSGDDRMVGTDGVSTIWNFPTLTLMFGNGGGNQGGNSRSAGILERLQFDTSLQLLPIRQEQVALHHIESERSRLQFESRQNHHAEEEDEVVGGYVPINARQQMLEHLAPQWFHRFDLDSDVPHQRRHETIHRAKENGEKEGPRINKKRHRSKAFAKPAGGDGEKHSGEMTQHGALPFNNTNTRVLTVQGGSRDFLPVRTIHNMQTIGTNHSRCQFASDTSSGNSALIHTTTLVTQTTISRLWILKETCHRWKQPIIVTVFVPPDLSQVDAITLTSQENELLGGGDCEQLSLIRYMADADERGFDKYPVNRLRNIGLDHVTTSHILVMDIDFVPSRGLDQLIQEALKLRDQEMTNNTSHRMNALVVPAFERLPPTDCNTDSDCAQYLQRNSSFLPSTFDELHECVGAAHCIVFQSDVSLDSHSTTRSNEWLERKWYVGDSPKRFRSIPCFHTARYEPYVVLEWCPSARDSAVSSQDSQHQRPLSPYYDERFHGYGKNKIELISHLRKSGYGFEILPEGFIVHNPHPESSSKEVWNDRGNSDLHKSMDTLYSKFLEELDIMYASQHNQSIKLCH